MAGGMPHIVHPAFGIVMGDGLAGVRIGDPGGPSQGIVADGGGAVALGARLEEYRMSPKFPPFDNGYLYFYGRPI
jgi:hypothetical protein